MTTPLRHLYIPDMQIKPGEDLSHCDWLGKYIVHKKPDKIVLAGDFYDLPSLSSYDIGKLAAEGRRYEDDIAAGAEAMSRIMSPLIAYNNMQKRNKKGGYYPDRYVLLGNHEDRITRAVQNDPRWEGKISLSDLCFESYGWRVQPFLQPLSLDGIMYNHYFVSGAMGRPCSRAVSILNKYHMSCVAGHQQGRDIAYARKADGSTLTAIIAGSYYQHDEPYMSWIPNRHWRGVYMFHEVSDGSFDEMAVSLNYLKRKYGYE